VADVQLEHGYTRIADELYEAIMRAKLTLQQKDVLHAVIRLTYGFQRENDVISASQISARCGIRRSHVSDSLRQLAHMNVIHMESRGTRKACRIAPVKDYDTWECAFRILDPNRGQLHPEQGSTVPGSAAPSHGQSAPSHGQICTPSRVTPEREKELPERNPHSKDPEIKSPVQCDELSVHFPTELFGSFTPLPLEKYQEMGKPCNNTRGFPIEPLEVAEWHAWQFCVKGLKDNKPRGMTAAIKKRWSALNRYTDEIAAGSKWCKEVRWTARLVVLRAASDLLPEVTDFSHIQIDYED